jgi:hypothetical protein
VIFAMLKGELPPRGLDGVDDTSTVGAACDAVRTAFKTPPDARCVLRAGDVELDDPGSTLGSYGVRRDALLHAEVM